MDVAVGVAGIALAEFAAKADVRMNIQMEILCAFVIRNEPILSRGRYKAAVIYAADPRALGGDRAEPMIVLACDQRLITIAF